MTFRALADELRRVDPDKRGLSDSHLVNLAQGRQPPSERALKLAAGVFGLDSAYFLEARAQAMRDRLDLRHHDVSTVLWQLDMLDAACIDQHNTPDKAHIEDQEPGPDSQCGLCGYRPTDTFGPGAQALLKPHPNPAAREEPRLLCANCHFAVHAGWRRRPHPGAHLIPPVPDNPGEIRTYDPYRARAPKELET